MKLERPLLSLDFETTGKDPVEDRIVEMGAVLMRVDGTRARWCQRFHPGRPIPAEATAVHGISDADVAAAPKFAEYAGRIMSLLRGKDFVGYNLLRFDLPLLDEELRRCGSKLEMDSVRVLDALVIFQKKDPRTLADAYRKYCGKELEGAHGAQSDAEASLDVLIGQQEMYEDIGQMDVAALAEFSLPSEKKMADLAGKMYYDATGVLRYAFGKHVDKPVIDNLDYADWIVNKAKFPGSTRDLLKSVMDAEWGGSRGR